MFDSKSQSRKLAPVTGTNIRTQSAKSCGLASPPFLGPPIKPKKPFWLPPFVWPTTFRLLPHRSQLTICSKPCESEMKHGHFRRFCLCVMLTSRPASRLEHLRLDPIDCSGARHELILLALTRVAWGLSLTFSGVPTYAFRSCRKSVPERSRAVASEALVWA